jgi:hypothetical protein
MRRVLVEMQWCMHLESELTQNETTATKARNAIVKRQRHPRIAKKAFTATPLLQASQTDADHSATLTNHSALTVLTRGTATLACAALPPIDV